MFFVRTDRAVGFTVIFLWYDSVLRRMYYKVRTVFVFDYIYKEMTNMLVTTCIT